MDNEENSTLRKAFVIGPIGDKDAPDGSPARVAYEEGIQVFEEVIVPACIAFGVEADRADMISRSGEIPEQIFRQLRDCPVVIADLTGANPNVMYELGLRHTTGKVTIQIGEKGRLPFDVAAIRTIMFKRTDSGLVQARKDISKALAANLDTGGDPVTATRVWFESTTIQKTTTELALDETDAVVSEDDEGPGFLELLADMEQGIQSLSQTMFAATSIAGDISAIYTDATESVRQADARGGNAAAARLSIADRTASRLDEQAARLEVVTGEYGNTVERVEPGIIYLLNGLAEDPDQLLEVPDFFIQIRALCGAAQASVESTLTMRASTLEMGKASRSLKRVAQRLALSLQKFAAASSRIGSWNELVDKLPNVPPNSDTTQA